MSESDYARAYRICEAFEVTQRAMWSSIWPLGHCAVSSLLLAPMLRAALGTPHHVVVGYVEERDRNRPGAHAWVADSMGTIFDPTYRQFDKVEPLRAPALRVQPWTYDMHPYCPVVSLTLDGEERWRRSIQPRYRDGWEASSGVVELFREVERRWDRGDVLREVMA